jgi:hypothetical protein
MDHEARAAELAAIGLDNKADRVLKCGADRHGALKCKQRVCPTCAAGKARANAVSAGARSAKFSRPMFITLTVGPRGQHGLREGLDSFRRALSVWRRKAVVKRFVKGATGGIEPKYSARQLPLWLVHGHFIIDAAPGIDLDALAAAWLDATGGKGRLLVPPKLGADVQDVERAAAYLSKHADWSPRPGMLPDAALHQLFQSLHGRQLLLRWGTGKPPRKVRKAMP